MEATCFFRKMIRSLIMLIFATFFVLAPLRFLISPDRDGKLDPSIEQQRALALEVGILENQVLNASYISGDLNLQITGTPVLSLGLLSKQIFVYQLPEELRYILSNDNFANFSQIIFNAPPLVYSYIIEGSSLSLNITDGTITGERTSLLNASLLTSMSAKLVIDLEGLGVTSLPPSSDGKLEFYAIAAKDPILDLSLLVSEGAADVLDTTPLAPTVNPVTDLDTVVTGTGEAGATVKIVASGISYFGTVETDGSFSVNIITARDAGTEITATQIINARESEAVSTTVTGAILEFSVPSIISFKSTMVKYQEVIIPRIITSWSINVRDTRGQGSMWRIKAQASGPLTAVGGYTLDPKVLVFIKNSEVFPLNEEVLIHEGTTGTAQETTVQWGENEGILIKMIPLNFTEVQPGLVYSATINWTLEDAP